MSGFLPVKNMKPIAICYLFAALFAFPGSTWANPEPSLSPSRDPTLAQFYKLLLRACALTTARPEKRLRSAEGRG